MIENLARLGYAAKGVVYSIIGLLALGSVFGRGRVTDHQGAFATILVQPFGKLLLYIVALGLLGYGIWRIVEAVANPENRKAIVRLVLFIRGVFHGYLAYEAVTLSKGGAEHWTATVMEKPFGESLLMLGGAGVAVYGLGQIIAALLSKLDKRLRIDRPWMVKVGRLGIASRGVVFTIIGWFLIRAARHQDPSQTRDVGGALREVAQGPRGDILLAIVAVGLLAYGVYELLKARYKRIATP